MTQCNTLDVKLSKSQLNSLKSGIKNGAVVNLKFLSNVLSDSNDANSLPLKFLLTNTQLSRIRKAFANGSSANIKLSKTQLHKVGQLGGRLLRPLLKTGLTLTKKLLNPLAKCVLILLGSTASSSAADVAV